MTSDAIELARQHLQRALANRDQVDLSWLELSPEQYGWTLAADALKLIDALVRDLKPKHVIEFGAGLSTKVLARACQQMNSPCAISSIDHDPQYGVADTARFVGSSNGLQLSSQIAPLVARDYGAKLLPTYLMDAGKFASRESADLVLIDGPPVNLGGREGVLYQVLEFCRPGTIVLLDDAKRVSERLAVRNWQETLGDAIEVAPVPSFTKGMAALIVRRIVSTQDLWDMRLAEANKQIENLVAADARFVLVEPSSFDHVFAGRRPIPLVSHEHEDWKSDWGSPESDDVATRELEDRRREGATHFVLPWTSFWWTDCYPKFFAQLRREYRCVADGDLLLAFDLRK